MGPWTGLDTVSKIKIPSSLRESKSDHPIFQPVASNQQIYINDEVLSGYQPGQMVERWKNKRFEYPGDEDRDGLRNVGFLPLNHLTADSPRGLHHTQTPGKQQISNLHQVAVFCVLTPCSDVIRTRALGDHAASNSTKTDFTLKMKTARSSETLISYHITTRCYNAESLDPNPHPRENLKSQIEILFTQ